MKFLLSILFCIFSLNSFASDPNRFESVLENFNQGTRPTFEEVAGWWTGRCFESTSPDTATGVMLAVESHIESVGENDGPLFPPIAKVVNNLAFLSYGSPTPPDFFDNMSEKVRTDIAAFLMTNTFRDIIGYTANNSLIADNIDGNMRFSVRKNGDYFYGTSTVITDGIIYSACYFFNKVN